eukprot:scaffold158434_cov51-Attheya_sp.AAC.4
MGSASVKSCTPARRPAIPQPTSISETSRFILLFAFDLPRHVDGFVSKISRCARSCLVFTADSDY